MEEVYHRIDGEEKKLIKDETYFSVRNQLEAVFSFLCSVLRLKLLSNTSKICCSSQGRDMASNAIIIYSVIQDCTLALLCTGQVQHLIQFKFSIKGLVYLCF